jgi:hypothetical protein
MTKENTAYWRNNHREYIKKYNKEWMASHLEYFRKYNAHIREDHHDMKLAYLAVFRAVKSGKLIRPTKCQFEDCTAEKVEAHHYMGYIKPFQTTVLWLCKKHHCFVEGRTTWMNK